jgi:hypothetical protein
VQPQQMVCPNYLAEAMFRLLMRFWYATRMRVLRLVAPPLLTVQQWISELGRGTADTMWIATATVKRMQALAVSAGAEAEFRKVSARSGHAKPTH